MADDTMPSTRRPDQHLTPCKSKRQHSEHQAPGLAEDISNALPDQRVRHFAIENGAFCELDYAPYLDASDVPIVIPEGQVYRGKPAIHVTERLVVDRPIPVHLIVTFPIDVLLQEKWLIAIGVSVGVNFYDLWITHDDKSLRWFLSLVRDTSWLVNLMRQCWFGLDTELTLPMEHADGAVGPVA